MASTLNSPGSGGGLVGSYPLFAALAQSFCPGFLLGLWQHLYSHKFLAPTISQN